MAEKALLVINDGQGSASPGLTISSLANTGEMRCLSLEMGMDVQFLFVPIEGSDEKVALQ